MLGTHGGFQEELVALPQSTLLCSFGQYETSLKCDMERSLESPRSQTLGQDHIPGTAEPGKSLIIETTEGCGAYMRDCRWLNES